MPGLIKFDTGGEGLIFCKWLHSRLIKHNKNVLSAELGPTGSGKSYRDLRKAELWYEYHFKSEFPTENICFGLSNVMDRINKGNLRKGDVLIVEEAGVNLGSRDWASKFSKMFNYVLQSFRSMNIALFLNLPYLSMLDSQARHLLHYYAESVGIDYENGFNKCKPFFLQVAQGTGKIYRHYPKVKLNGKTIKVKKFNYAMPSQYLVDAYEDKKAKYLKELIKNFSEKMDKESGVKKIDLPSEIEIHAYKLSLTGKKQVEIAKELEKNRHTIKKYIEKVKKYLNKTKITGNNGGC